MQKDAHRRVVLEELQNEIDRTTDTKEKVERQKLYKILKYNYDTLDDIDTRLVKRKSENGLLDNLLSIDKESPEDLRRCRSK